MGPIPCSLGTKVWLGVALPVLTALVGTLMGGADDALNTSLASEPGGVARARGNGRRVRSKCDGTCHLLSGEQE